jgi:hypothetical protein
MKAVWGIALFVLGFGIVGCLTQAGNEVTPEKAPVASPEVFRDLNNNVDPLFFSDHQEFMAMQKAYGQPLEGLSASSTKSPQGKNNYAANRMWDFDSNTAWVEGEAEYGVGESISFTWRARMHDHTCGSISIMNGYQKSRVLMEKNSRVKAMDLYADGKLRARLDVQDRLGYQIFGISRLGLKDGDIIKLVIREVYKGSKWKDTCISELTTECVP